MSNLKGKSAMKLKMKLDIKRKEILRRLEQEKFRIELNDDIYACYTNLQKEAIMDAIRFTRWDITTIRNIFQNENIKENIDKFLYIFSILKSENRALHFLSWDIICDITNNLNKEIHFALAVKILEEFVSNPTWDNYNKVSNLVERFITKNQDIPDDYKLELFKSVLYSTEKGLDIGNKLLYLYNIIRDMTTELCDEECFPLISKVYMGMFDYFKDAINAIEYIYSIFDVLRENLTMFQGPDEDFWEFEDNQEQCEKLINIFKQLINKSKVSNESLCNESITL